MPHGTDRQQLLAGLEQLEKVHEIQREILDTYQDLEISLKELQVRGFRILKKSNEHMLSLAISRPILRASTGASVTFTDSCKRRSRCHDASKNP